MSKPKNKHRSKGSLWIKITVFCLSFFVFIFFCVGNTLSKNFLQMLYGEENVAESAINDGQNENIDEINISDEYNLDSETILQGNGQDIVYFSQDDSRWSNEYYGNGDDMATYGCGPSVLAMIVSSLTESKTNPLEMAKWAYDNGYYSRGSGSYHSIIPEGSEHFGLKVTNLQNSNRYEILDYLENGKIVVALMGKGYFTEGGHFIILRGISNQGQLLIADSKNKENNDKGFNIELILNEAKKNSSSGGPFWLIEKN